MFWLNMIVVNGYFWVLHYRKLYKHCRHINNMYTEIQKKGNKNYYYRVRSVRRKDKIEKIKKYLGKDLTGNVLKKKEIKADNLLEPLNLLLIKKELNSLELIKKEYLKIENKTFENRYEYFVSQFTFDSNAIEGNTLSLQETSFILFEHKTPKGKSLREINEVINHKKAFDYLLAYKGDITRDFILELHRLVVKEYLDA